MKVVAFEIEDWERSSFLKLQPDHEVRFVPEPLSLATAGQAADAAVVSTFIYSTARREVLEKLGHLRLIATRSTGVDHIDTVYCASKGIKVANVPSYGKNTVAEHTFALLLAISHRLIESVERTRQGRFSPRGLQGFDLCDKTLGIVGTGDIGRWVARIASGFGMKILAFDLRQSPDLVNELGVRYVGLEELLGRADIVTLHVPFNDKTRHMIGHAQFELMKDGAILLNTARGEIVDTEALVEALHRGKLKGAGLDVLPLETAIREEAELLRRAFELREDVSTLLADQLLLHMPNVIVTPHSAFNTREAVQRILDVTMDNILAFARGESRNLIPAGEPA